MLGKRLKHAHRYQEIINAFLRNGFSYFIYRIGLSEKKSVKKKLQDSDNSMNLRSIGKRLRTLSQTLGTTFIKLGQIASTRRDIIPAEIVSELEQLQDQVEPFTFDKVRSIIETELGRPLEDLFSEFDPFPLATASIGQVHSALLPSGKRVAVKIQRPHIQPNVETDLEIMDDIARLMEARLSWAKRYQIRKIIGEFARTLRAELDYNAEGRNSERAALQFKDDPAVSIPSIHWDYTTKRVLTMDFVKGIKVNQLEKLDEGGYDRKLIAERLTHAILHQVLIEGFFHGDPHPGNIIILPDNVVSLMDFGMVGRLSEEMKFQFASLVMYLQRGKTEGIIKTLEEMDLISDETNMKDLRFDIDDLRVKYYDKPLSKLSLGNALNDLFSTAYRHQVRIPPELTILGKTILTIEAIVENLDPEFSIMKAAEPFGQQLFFERYNPKTAAKKTWSQFIDFAESLSELPKNIREVSTVIQKGKLKLDINVPELALFLKRLDKISNRLSFSIILLAFSIIMVGLIIGAALVGESSLLWRVPAIEIGSIVACLMFLLLIYTIIRSGRM
ncbi:ABC1 kinase family protein [Bacillus massiliglaciei]|uniref:ABC1 kinase family protein n=1 Tax=Bacillus massiliglaciei TaxID=1816693 RepID=UPI000ABF3F44|nr:AarF/ABC1/UbiB kinase family protein [Bacillus massiliglaciei]